MKKLRILAVALLLASVCSLASAQEFSDNFDSYPSGSALHGVGGWKGWDNTAGAGAPTSSQYAYNGKNSVEILASSDFVHEFTPNGGKWEFTLMQYIPSGTTGIQYFILMNQYASGRDWSVQTQYDLASGTITADYHSTNSGMKIVYDKWVKIRFLIDLTANSYEEYYDGVKIAAGQWDDNSHTTFEAIDLYGNNASSIYYDDLQLTAYVESSPADGATDVLREAQLSWKGGDNTAKYDVYFGTSPADVADATAANPLGVLVGTGQTEATFDPGRLAIGQTYYWRIDRVGGVVADARAKGRVWSFTVEPFSYVVAAASIAATASSVAGPGMGPAKTIDGSGLNAADQHSTNSEQMWLSRMGDAQPWIQYDFDKTYSLDKMLVWNSNQAVELMLGFGSKAVTIEVSTDGQTWTALGDFEFAQATAKDDYAANTTIDCAGAPARHVKLTIHGNWGGAIPQAGLSEVRFYQIPLSAREPQPAGGATAVAPDTTLTWRAGREAARHEVYLGTDAADLAKVGTVEEAAFTPELGFNQTYSWKVVEANEVETPSSWDSDIWSFTTGSFVVIDDFEGYTNDEGSRIYQAWIDGMTDGKNGSQVGYDQAPFAERTKVNGGAQSLPLKYNNASFAFSEATRTFSPAQDWTARGATTLSLHFAGTSGSKGQLYVKINNTKVAYDGEATDLARAGWQAWNIDLAKVGNVQSVKSLTIGVEGTGNSGLLYVDDIRLSPTALAFTLPVEPPAATLIARYALNGDVKDSSGKNRNGTANGGPTYVAGVDGQALKLDGMDDYVVVGSVGISGAAPRTIAGWVKAETTTITDWTNLFGFTSSPDGVNAKSFDMNKIGGANNYCIHAYGWERSIMPVDLEWHHLAATYDGTTIVWYGDGQFVAGEAHVLDTQDNMQMGKRAHAAGGNFPGLLDEVRIYNKAISAEEIAWLAGRKLPIHKPL